MLSLLTAALISVVNVSDHRASPLCPPSMPASAIAMASEDTAKLARWYVERLGFQQVLEIELEGLPNVYLITCGATMLEIMPANSARQAKESGVTPTGLFKFGWQTEDFEAAHGWLKDQGIEIVSGPVSDNNGYRFMMFYDPDRNLIQLFENLSPSVSEKTAEMAITKEAKNFSRAYMAGNSKMMADIYTEHGVAMPGALAPIVGRNQLSDFWKTPEGVSITHHETKSESLIIDGRYAFDRGAYHGQSERGGEATNFSGRYFIVWEQGADGKWRMSYDMWAANR